MHENSNNIEEEPLIEEYNHRIVNLLDEYLLDHSTILELGSGNGADLAKLSKNYQVIGLDISKENIQKINEKYPELEMRLIDVREMDIDGKFDCIYSNKLLSYLTKEELTKVLEMKANHLNDEGMILMTLNYGDYREEQDQENNLINSYYTEFDISQLVPESLRIDLIDSYAEEEKEDSLLVILRKRSF